MGKPVIAIINTWSEINSCHSHFRQRAEEVKRGVWQAGGFPIEMPAISLAEPFQKPTTMLYRNLLAMETEELLRSYPADGAVLMGGCDKTTPALVMGALSMNLPTIFVPAGPMLRGDFRGQFLGSGSDTWKYWAELRAGNITEDDWRDVEDGIARSPGPLHDDGHGVDDVQRHRGDGPHAARRVVDPRAGLAPPADGDALGQAHRRDGVGGPDDHATSSTQRAIDNAVTTVLALGGSTNAIVHLIAMARRAGVDLDLDRFDALARRTPVLTNVRPSGKYLMEDFYYAGGLRGLLSRLTDLLDLTALTVNGRTLGENIEGAAGLQRRRDPPARQSARRATTASPCCAATSRPTARSSSPPRWSRSCSSTPALPSCSRTTTTWPRASTIRRSTSTKDSVLVLQSAGPQGAPGLPEWGQLPIPKKLLQQGVRDMLRISDARMSGTSYGACVLHVAPESHIGGPLALVQGRRPHRARRARPHAERSRSTTRSSRAAAPHGRRPSRTTRAASARCISSTSPRPTKAAISTSSKRKAKPATTTRNPLNVEST